MKLDCLLLHIPRLKCNQILVLPMGLFPLANLLESEGHPTRILHYGLRIERDPTFDLSGFVEETGAKIVGFDLHWHYQLPDVLKKAALIKHKFPEVKIVLGGYTASCFFSEIMEEMDFIDYVIRGDAEEPLLRLVRQVVTGKPDHNIPNLVKREGKSIIVNEMGYQNTKNNSIKLSHADYSLLLDSDKYFSDTMLYPDFNLSSKDNLNDVYTNSFFYNPGKGCPVNCSYCGGSCDSQKKLFNRDGHFFFDSNKVFKELKHIRSKGIHTIRTCFDPEVSRDYYLRLFKRLRDSELRFRMIFDCWSLPTPEFVDSFSKTFSSDSIITISADCGSEIVRKKNKGFHFTNQELLDMARLIINKDIRAHIFLSFGVPYEKKSDIIITKNLVIALKKLGANCSVIPMYLDPYSPLFMDPEKFSVSLSIKGPKEFFRAYLEEETSVNYSTSKISEKEIMFGCGYLMKFC